MNPRYPIHSTKVHGSWPQGDHGQDHGRSSITSTKKRSLRRAYRRLDTHGYTWYKGRYWQKQIILPTQPDFVPKPAAKTCSQPPEHIPKNRLIVFHWNGGALSSARYNELLQWLHFHRVDVAIISETHWSYTSEWQTPHWNAIHSGHGSGQKDKASGLLVLIATKLCRPEQIVWREVEAGRLVHCRLHLHPRSFDIIGVYQHTWNTAVVQKARRKQIWSSLAKLLQEIPHRNSLCILGDFNCSLPMIPRLVGQAHYVTPTGKKLGPQHGDSFLYNISPQHFSTTPLYNTLLQHSPPTLLFNNSLQNFSTTFSSNNPLQHFSTRLLHNAPSQHFSTTLPTSTSPQDFSTTLLHNTSPQHSFTTLLYNTWPRHFTTTLFHNTSPQHSFTTLLYNT